MDIQSVSSQPFTKKVHIDHILRQQIGFGPAQYKLALAISLLLFSEGCESIVLGLLLPVLKKEWDLSPFQLSMLVTCVYLGVTLGSYLQSFSDIYGRKIFITSNIVMQSIFGLLSCICWNYQSFLFARFCYGVAMGVCFPLSGSYISQIAPPQQRVKLLFYTKYFFSSGALVTCVLAWYLLSSNSWRILLFIICLPGIYAYFKHQKYGRESLKFLWIHKREEEVIQMIKFMCQENGKELIDQQRIRGMLAIEQFQETKAENISFGQLMNQKYRNSTWRLILCWFVAMFVYYGIMILLPSILQTLFSSVSSYNFKYFFIFMIAAVQISCYSIWKWIIDHPNIGRKKSVFYGALSSCILIIFVIIIGTSSPMLLLAVFLVIKFGNALMVVALYPYTAQIYDTLYRGKALGICSMSGRIGVIVLGLVGVHAIGWFNGNGLYVLFAGLSGIASTFAITMPYCTLNKLTN